MSILSIVWRSIVSLFFALSVAFQKEKIGLMELTFLLVLLITTWGGLILNYFIILVRIQGQLRPILGRTVKYVLYADRISWSSDHGVKDVLWWDLDTYAKSSEVTLFYSSRRKTLMFFPNAMLSEKAQAYMSEKFNEAVTARLNERLKPPILASPSSFKKKYLTAIIVFSVLVVAMLLHWNHGIYLHLPTNASMETNNIIRH